MLGLLWAWRIVVALWIRGLLGARHVVVLLLSPRIMSLCWRARLMRTQLVSIEGFLVMQVATPVSRVGVVVIFVSHRWQIVFSTIVWVHLMWTQRVWFACFDLICNVRPFFVLTGGRLSIVVAWIATRRVLVNIITWPSQRLAALTDVLGWGVDGARFYLEVSSTLASNYEGRCHHFRSF